MKKLFAFNLVMVLSFLFGGCLEYEALDMHCDCRSVGHALRFNELTGEWEMTEDELLQESCQHYMKSLEGKWDGLGMTESNRLVFHPDGTYDFLTKSGEDWALSSSGEYWVEMTRYRGKPYPELHMTWPDNDDYPIRFHFEEDVLHLEEATDGGEPEMRYRHVLQDES